MAEQGGATTPLSPRSAAVGKSASRTFVEAMTNIIDHQSIRDSLQTQNEIYNSLSTTSKSLAAFNEESATAFASLSGEFTAHTKKLVALKKDLDLVTRRISLLKGLLRREFPTAFPALDDDDENDDEEEEEEEEEDNDEGEGEEDEEDEEDGEEDGSGEIGEEDGEHSENSGEDSDEEYETPADF